MKKDYKIAVAGTGYVGLSIEMCIRDSFWAHPLHSLAAFSRLQTWIPASLQI